jgi:phosphoribosylformylglycinamidine cyclo-ligase
MDAANITGGGLADNIKRIIPDGLAAHIDLNKVKTKKIFKWLKLNKIDDKEMLKTFNCGVGFCLVIDPKNLNNNLQNILQKNLNHMLLEK